MGLFASRDKFWPDALSMSTVTEAESKLFIIVNLKYDKNENCFNNHKLDKTEIILQEQMKLEGAQRMHISAK